MNTFTDRLAGQTLSLGRSLRGDLVAGSRTDLTIHELRAQRGAEDRSPSTTRCSPARAVQTLADRPEVVA